MRDGCAMRRVKLSSAYKVADVLLMFSPNVNKRITGEAMSEYESHWQGDDLRKCPPVHWQNPLFCEIRSRDMLLTYARMGDRMNVYHEIVFTS